MLMLKTELGEPWLSLSLSGLSVEIVLFREVKDTLGEVVMLVSEEAERDLEELLELLALLEVWR